MAIKWKNFPNWFYHSALKAIACIVLVVCTGTILLTAMFGVNISYTNVMDSSYMASNARTAEMTYIAKSANRLLKTYKNEEFVRSGGTVNMEELQQGIIDEYYSEYYDTYNEDYYQDSGNTYRQSRETATEYAEGEITERNERALRAMLEEKILTDHAEELEQKKQEEIAQSVQNYFTLVESLNQSEGTYYYATDGQTVVGNVSGVTKEFFQEQPAYFLYDHGKYEMDSKIEGYSDLGNVTANDEIYVAFSAELVAQRETEFSQDKQYMEQSLLYIILMAATVLVTMLYLLFAAGRKAGDDAIHLCPVDRIYTDISVVLGITIGLLTAGACVGLLDCFNNYHHFANLEQYQITVAGGFAYKPVVFISLSAAVYAGIAAELILILSLVRKLKAKQLLSHSLIAAIVRKLWHGIRKLWCVFRRLLNKGPVLLVSSQQLSQVRSGVQKVKDGYLDFRIELPPDKALYELAQDINTMSDGLQKAVEKELKAERLKTELITNVSHDLKTPLTSIINYSDLLTREELTPDYANDYAKVLKDKSEKLKQLTNDLFEISKVQSGNIDVQREKLQVKVLIEQAIAEYEEKFREVGLQVRVAEIPDDLYIQSDGKKMARVLENLVINILKYAQPQTRVYVDVLERGENCEIVFKNIANYEMNFSADEIIQRFARGDKSRTTEGNGLGLAIAQSYVEACGGTFRVEVDGDLFKATISFEILKQQ